MNAEARPKKSLLASGALSFFFGPLGFLYAAPFRVAIPASAAWVLTAAICPTFILVYVVALVCPLSAIAGTLYAWSFNHAGARVPLFGADTPKKLAK